MQQPGSQTWNGGAPISNGGAGHHCPPRWWRPCVVVNVCAHVVERFGEGKKIGCFFFFVMKECCANPTSDWKNIRFPSNHIRLWNIFMCMCVLYCHRFQEIWLLHGASRRYIFLLWFIFESVWLHAMCTNFRAQFEIIHAFATVLTHQKELLFHDLFCGGSFDMQSSWCSLCCHFVFHLEIHVGCSWCVYHVR